MRPAKNVKQTFDFYGIGIPTGDVYFVKLEYTGEDKALLHENNDGCQIHSYFNVYTSVKVTDKNGKRLFF